MTGSIIAFKGTADSNGMFEVEDYCYAGPAFPMPLPSQIKLNENRDLFDMNLLKSKSRKFIAFVSGLEFGLPSEKLSYEHMLRFLRGELGGPKE